MTLSRSVLDRRVAVKLLAQHALENLAAGIARNLFNKFHHLWLFKSRQLSLAKFQHVTDGQSIVATNNNGQG